jgi:hypothetical protein
MSTTKATRSKPPRHEVISVRLNEDRLNLLDRHRAALSRQLGREVSLAEAAFLVFEDRAPQVDRAATRDELLQTPTESLERIRTRWAAEHTLSAAEWDVLADYIVISTEEERQEPPYRRPAAPSRFSYLALLDAFEALYAQRARPTSPHAALYLSHLTAITGRAPVQTDADRLPQALEEQIARQREQLQHDDTWLPPGNLGRCLLLAIHDEGLDDATLSRVLAPYWPTLWGLAARGHWIRHDHEPVRVFRMWGDDVRREITLPGPLTAGDLTVSFEPKGRPDLVIELDFGPTRRFSIVLGKYPDLVEFRAMLDVIPDPLWNGRYFQNVLSTASGVTLFKLRAKASDVVIQLTEAEWHALGDLFRDAWQRPEVARWLAELQLEYGEQG